MKDVEIEGIPEVLSAFFSGRDFDVKTLGKGLGAIIEFALAYFKSLTQTREGVGMSAFLLGVMLKQAGFKGVVDLFPVTLGKQEEGVDYCEIPGGGIVKCDSLTEEQRANARLISRKEPVVTIPAEFGEVYVSDALMWVGMGLMLGSTAMDIVKGFFPR